MASRRVVKPDRPAATGSSPEADAATRATEMVLVQLRIELGRWIGGEGYRTLFARAVAIVRVDHPAIVGVSAAEANASTMADAVATYGAGPVASATNAVVATLTELLGRIVGDEMAVRLVEQAGQPRARETKGAESEREHNG